MTRWQRAAWMVLSAVLMIMAIETTLPAQALAESDNTSKPYGRLVVDKFDVRRGPGFQFSRVSTAKRGDIFPILERSTQSYWLRIELPDGITGWVLGDAVHVEALSSEQAQRGQFMPWLFAPPPLTDAHAEMNVNLGVLGGSGMIAMRPTWLIDPTFGVEGTLAASVGSGGRLFIGTLGGIINLFPRSPIVPFFDLGGGGAMSEPNADTFLLESGSTFAMYAGGGLRFGFKSHIILRFDARTYAFYQPDRFVRMEEFSGGISAFF